jgi:hypothetical protein
MGQFDEYKIFTVSQAILALTEGIAHAAEDVLNRQPDREITRAQGDM